LGWSKGDMICDEKNSMRFAGGVDGYADFLMNSSPSLPRSQEMAHVTRDRNSTKLLRSVSGAWTVNRWRWFWLSRLFTIPKPGVIACT
jgi:hypothetical protein